MTTHKINHWLSLASPSDWSEGIYWYKNAHEIAQYIADKYNLSINAVIGVIACLSPAVSWHQNIVDTVGLINDPNYKCSTYGNNVKKAISIINGRTPESVLNNKNSGFKTYSFYLNILHPNTSGAVTIDRHAVSVAVKDPDSNSINTRGKYNKVADLYRRAGKKAGLLPHQVQAIVWITFRRVNNTNFSDKQPLISLI